MSNALENTPDLDVPRASETKESKSDLIFKTVARSAGVATVGIMLAVGLFLSLNGAQAIAKAGWSFLSVQQWDTTNPQQGSFGIAAVLFGTIQIALIALCVSFPLSFGSALLISEVLPNGIKSFVISVVDLMAAVPSVIFGLWGVFFLQSNVIPVSKWISEVAAFLPFLAVTDESGAALSEPSAFTSSSFIAGIVVGLMVVPTQTSVMREAFSQAPIGEREGALALGSTRWGMITSVVLPYGRGGIIGGTMLGLGRALGETIAVYMIISPIFAINWQILKSGGNSVSALIALRYGEASPFGLSALMAAGLVLFLITMAINFTASSIVARSRSGVDN